MNNWSHRVRCSAFRKSLLVRIALSLVIVLGAGPLPGTLSLGAPQPGATGAEEVLAAAQADRSDSVKGKRKSGGQSESTGQESEGPESEGPESEGPAGTESDASTSEAAGSSSPNLAITGATLVTLGSGGVIENGVVLIDGKTILAVGDSGLEVPEGVETVDVSGCILTPGLIDASSRLWLTDAAATSTASDASLDVTFGIDAFDEQWNEVVRYGVTSVYVQPSSRGTLSGYGAVLSVAPGDASGGGGSVAFGPEILSECAALQAAIGPGASNNKSRLQQLDRIKKAFKAAADYQEKWDKYNEYIDAKKKKDAGSKDTGSKESKASDGDAKKKSDAGGRDSDGASGGTAKGARRGPGPEGGTGKRRGTGRGGPPGRGGPSPNPRDEVDSKRDAESKKVSEEDSSKSGDKDGDADSKKKEEKPPKKPDFDAAKERLAKVVSGSIPLRLEIHTADDAHYARELLSEFPKLQFVLSGLADLGSATETIVETGVPVVLGPWLNLSGDAARDETVADWNEAFSDYEGALVISTSGGSSRSSRLLRAHVARAISAGLTPERALKAVTIDAARTLGVDDQIGSIEAGKRADLVAFCGDATDLSSPVRLVISGGKVAFEGEASTGASVNQTVDQTGESESSSGVEALSALPSSSYALRCEHYVRSDGSVGPATLLVNPSDGTCSVTLGDQHTDVEEGIATVESGTAWGTHGLYSSHATLGLESLLDTGLSDATDVVAADAMSDGFNGESTQLATGVLRVLLAPSDRNTLSGTASVVRIGARDPVVAREAAVKFSLSGSARTPDRFPSSLAGQIQMVIESLAGQLLDTRLYLPQAVKDRLTSVRATKLQAIANGEMLALFQVESDADVQAALDLIEMHKLKAAIVGPAQLKPFVGRLAALGVMVIAKPVSEANYNWYFDDLAGASAAGVEIGFAGESAEQLRLTASLAIEAGVPRNKVLAALCWGPSTLQDSAAMDPGPAENDAKVTHADFVFWSADPTDLRAKPIGVIVDGRVVWVSDDASGLSK